MTWLTLKTRVVVVVEPVVVLAVVAVSAVAVVVVPVVVAIWPFDRRVEDCKPLIAPVVLASRPLWNSANF